MPAEFEVRGRYTALRLAVVEAGLLERAYGYYLWRGSVAFGLLAAGIGLSFLLTPLAVSLLVAAPAIAFGSVQVALIGHDAGHLAVFKTQRANTWLGSLCWTLSLGISFAYWRDRHNRHHASTNDPLSDPDLQWANLVAYSEVMASTRRRPASWLRRYQAILGPLYALFLPFAFRFEGWQFTVGCLRGLRRNVEVGLMLISTVLWLSPASLLGWAWIAVFCASQILAGVYLALAIAPNHKGMPVWPPGTVLSFLERQVLSSRNVSPHPVGDFVFGGLNYQIEHHLFPTMPRNRFAAARALVKPFCRDCGLAYVEMGAFASYRLVFAELRRVGGATVTSAPV